MAQATDRHAILRARAVWRALLEEQCEALEASSPAPRPAGLLDAELPPLPRPTRPLADITPRVSLMRVLVDALAEPVPFAPEPAPAQDAGATGSRPARARRRKPDYGPPAG